MAVCPQGAATAKSIAKGLSEFAATANTVVMVRYCLGLRETSGPGEQTVQLPEATGRVGYAAAESKWMAAGEDKKWIESVVLLVCLAWLSHTSFSNPRPSIAVGISDQYS